MTDTQLITDDVRGLPFGIPRVIEQLHTWPDRVAEAREHLDACRDALDQAREALDLIEFKTASRSWPDGKVDTELQATMYSAAYRSIFGQWEQGITYVILVQTKKPTLQVLETSRDLDHYHRLFDITEQVHRAIEADVFYPSYGSGFFCPCELYEPWCREWGR